MSSSTPPAKSAKAISQEKLSSLGGHGLIQLPHEKQRREAEAKRKREEEEAAAVYQEFVDDFLCDDRTSRSRKGFVRGEVLNDDASADRPSHETGSSSLYSGGQASASKRAPAMSEATPVSAEPIRRGKGKEKKKSNLELFKEELKREQEEREERDRSKRRRLDDHHQSQSDHNHGNSDATDAWTTNIYVGNVSTNATEMEIADEFCRFGAVGSIKVMYPRSTGDGGGSSRRSMSAFVAFMKRDDAERALEEMNGRRMRGNELRCNWGKPVTLPGEAAYVMAHDEDGRPCAVRNTRTIADTVATSGLPFNAQMPLAGSASASASALGGSVADRMVGESLVRVQLPRDKNLRRLIHRFVEFVVREGPLFEATVMNAQGANPLFTFLYDNHSPAHIYYRWKLFSVLQGDSVDSWRTEPFHMFLRGPLWVPPSRVDVAALEQAEEEREMVARGRLRSGARDALETLLRELTDDRNAIARAMLFCLDHADAAEEIVECITESLSIVHTPIVIKVARLHLVSDLLYNSTAPVKNASIFRQKFEQQLPLIASELNKTYRSIIGRIRAEQFKMSVVNCLRVWQDWSLYPAPFIRSLSTLFLAPRQTKSTLAPPPVAPPTLVPGNDAATATAETASVVEPDDDIDGAPLDDDDDDIDGEPL